MADRRGRARSIAVGGATASLALLLGACNWTMFGFDPAHSGDNASQAAITPQNVSSLIDAGSTRPLRGQIDASPTTANGILYETADLGNRTGTLFAYSATGRVGCGRTVPKTCRPLWSRTPAGPHVLITSPTIDTADGVVYVGSADSQLYAYDATSGALRWESPPLGGSAGASPTIAGGYLYLPVVYGWTYVFPLSTGYDGKNPSCLTRVTGVRTCRPAWGYYTPGDVYASPAVADGLFFTNVGIPNDTLYAYDATFDSHCTGTEYAVPLGGTCDEPLWTASTGAGKSSAAVADGTVFIGSVTAGLLAFSADGSTGCSGTPYTYLRGMTCTPLWTADTGRQDGLATPATADGVVYMGTRSGNLDAFDDADGRLLWSAPTGGTIDSAAVISDGVVYVGCSNKYEPVGQACSANVFAFAATDGTPLWTGTTDGTSGTVDQSPLVVDTGKATDRGALYVGSSSGPSECVGTTSCTGRVYAFGPP